MLDKVSQVVPLLSKLTFLQCVYFFQKELEMGVAFTRVSNLLLYNLDTPTTVTIQSKLKILHSLGVNEM